MSEGTLEARLVRRVGDIAGLYSAFRRGDPSRSLEFIDALDPGVPRAKKWVIMVSTQFGCPVGCAICDAGDRPYRGNVSGEEILEQVRRVLAAHPEQDPARVPKLKVHFARMGEPSFNEGVLEALSALGGGGRLPGLLPSVSSVAPRCARSAAFFETLRAVKDRWFRDGMFQLQFSVHSTDDEARRALVPIRTWSLEEMAEFGRRCALQLEEKILELGAQNVAGFIAEPFQGAGGMIFPPESYWPEIQRICRQYDVG